MNENEAEAPVAHCVPEVGVYCMPLARRVQGNLSSNPRGGLGYVQMLSQSYDGGPLETKFLGIGYKVPGMLDPGIMVNFCPWCGTQILRENAGHTPH